jgi:hypothetical protein
MAMNCNPKCKLNWQQWEVCGAGLRAPDLAPSILFNSYITCGG